VMRPPALMIDMLLDSPVQKYWQPLLGDQVVSVADKELVLILLTMDDCGKAVTLSGKRFELSELRWVPTFNQLLHLGATIMDLDCADFMRCLQRWQFWINRKYHQAGWYQHESMCILMMIHWMVWGISFDVGQKQLLRGEEALAYEAQGQERGRKTVTYLRGSRVEPDRNPYQEQG